LYLARALGLQVWAESQVTAVRALPGGGFRLEGRRGLALSRKPLSVTSTQVVLSAGVLGTNDLLLRMKAEPDGLPQLSDAVGRHVRTNSESFIGVITRRADADLSRGLAIGSIYHCAPNESVEPVRYSDGSGFFRMLMAPHVAGDTIMERLARLVLICLRHPLQVLRGYTARNMARKMSILMYMRTQEATLRLQRSWWGGADDPP
jgi:cholesterol oxidase